VTLQEDVSLYDFSRLWQDLQDYLGCEISLVSERALNETFKTYIEAEVIPL
jgi:predicted nucleotidyltransferase